MRRGGNLLRVLLATWFVAAPSCDQAETDEALDLARKVVFDLTTCAFTAERHFTADVGGETIDWDERVKSAGDGKNISVELVARNGLTRDQISDAAELEAFDLLAAHLAAGGGSRVLFQRDPIPDDVDRLLLNYEVSLVEVGREPITARGEPALTYKVEPIYADRPFYVLTASTHRLRQGFPIECQEYVQDANGPRLVSDMKVTSVTWGAPADVVAPASPIVLRSPLDSIATARQLAGQIGLSLFLPQDGSMPLGFELVKVEEVQYQTTANLAGSLETLTIYRFVYSDGLEHVDFIEHLPIDTLPPEFVQGHGGLGVDLAMIASFGSITIGSLFHSGTQITIESRIAADRFGLMLRSLVPL